MRKLVFAALAGVFMLSSGFATFESIEILTVDCSTELNIQTDLQIEVLGNLNSALEEVPCRWRTCFYRDGVKVSCTEWTYGDCSVNDDGSLQPGPIQLPTITLQG